MAAGLSLPTMVILESSWFAARRMLDTALIDRRINTVAPTYLLRVMSPPRSHSFKVKIEANFGYGAIRYSRRCLSERANHGPPTTQPMDKPSSHARRKCRVALRLSRGTTRPSLRTRPNSKQAEASLFSQRNRSEAIQSAQTLSSRNKHACLTESGLPSLRVSARNPEEII